jgi:AbrB family transcriptional regulator, transcriptional pleiotropic regulator of transition state genes
MSAFKNSKRGFILKFLGIARRVDDLGRIVLPIELRRQFGIEAGDALDIAVDPDSQAIVLRKTQDECVFCSSREDLREHRKRRVCRNCVSEMNGGPSNRQAATAADGGAP